MERKAFGPADRASRRAASVLTLFGSLLLVAALVVAGSAGAAGRTKGSQAPCGPRGAKSLATDGGLRIFRSGPAGSATAAIRVCRRGSKGAVTLGQGPVAAPFAISTPWAGGVESQAVGQDSVTVNLVGVDVESRERVHCLVGSADRPGQLPKVHHLWVGQDGSLIATATLQLAPSGPLLAVCRPGENALEVIARGSAVDLGSVTVKGNFVSWTEEGKHRTEQV